MFCSECTKLQDKDRRVTSPICQVSSNFSSRSDSKIDAVKETAFIKGLTLPLLGMNNEKRRQNVKKKSALEVICDEIMINMSTSSSS